MSSTLETDERELDGELPRRTGQGTSAIENLLNICLVAVICFAVLMISWLLSLKAWPL